jgi:beta-galactosidase
MASRISQMYKEFGNRRIAVSEYGAGANPAQHMEGVPGIEKSNAPLHPEEYQDFVHETDYAAIKDNPQLWGSFLWTMFDFPAAPRREGGTVGLNDKGMVTQDRQLKKDAFYFYKANWSEQPTVYIAARRLTPRRQNTTEVQVYSNCARVELKVNGKSLGEADKDRVNVCHWQSVNLQCGPNKIEAVAEAGGQSISDQCEWVVAPEPPAVAAPTVAAPAAAEGAQH